MKTDMCESIRKGYAAIVKGGPVSIMTGLSARMPAVGWRKPDSSMPLPARPIGLCSPRLTMKPGNILCFL